MPWYSSIIPYISDEVRQSLIAATVELVCKFDELEMLKKNEEPDTSRLQNIIFCGIATRELEDNGDFDPHGDYDHFVDEANSIVAEICAFIREHLCEVPRPVTAIIDAERNITRTEAWILRGSMHPDVVEGDEEVKAAWRSVLSGYLHAHNWGLETDEEESEWTFDCRELITVLSPGPEGLQDFFRVYSIFAALLHQPEESEELELAPVVELNPYGPRHEMEDLTDLNSSPPKDEECTIYCKGYYSQAEESACRQLKVCKSSFHEDCLDTWVNGSHAEVVTCPACRAEICDARPRKE